MTVADRMGVMHRGRLVQVGTPAEIYEEPNSRWVADFIGDVNLLEGKVSEDWPGGNVIASAGAGRLRTAKPLGMRAGEAVCIALRPEKVRISHERPAKVDENAVSGTVWDIGYLGDISLYKVKLGSGLVVEAAAPNAGHAGAPFALGDKVWLNWDADAGVVLTS